MANFLLYCMSLSGNNVAQGELGRDAILLIAILAGSAIIIIIVLVLLVVVCIMRTIKRNKKQK